MWAFIILILCTIKLGAVSKNPIFFAGFDKLVHCGLFFVMAVLTGEGVIRRRGRHFFSFASAFAVLLICLAYGGFIELIQKYLFTWRSGEWDDLFADLVGMSMGVFAILVTLFAVKHEKG